MHRPRPAVGARWAERSPGPRLGGSPPIPVRQKKIDRGGEPAPARGKRLDPVVRSVYQIENGSRFTWWVVPAALIVVEAWPEPAYPYTYEDWYASMYVITW